MTARFSVLASGSSGNSSLLWSPTFGLLIDFGLGPRQIASRFRMLGVGWQQIHAAVLTHTHGDHWRRETLQLLLRHKVPLYCHLRHIDGMASAMVELKDLRNAGLLRFYEPDEPFTIEHGFRCHPIEVSHDSFPTFAFRVDAADWSLGYASDLGYWTTALAETLRDVAVLAVEFNHDETMERNSSRPPHLIERVLGDRGHLSNRQAAEFVRTHIEQSERTALVHLVQLHLSRQCNVPGLAVEAAKRVIAAMRSLAQVHTAQQDTVLPAVRLDDVVRMPTLAVRPQPQPVLRQRKLPGFDELA